MGGICVGSGISVGAGVAVGMGMLVEASVGAGVVVLCGAQAERKMIKIEKKKKDTFSLVLPFVLIV